MGKSIWIGTRGHEEWFKAPAPRASFQPVGWSAITQGRNGRITGRRSRVTHMEYDLSWPVATAEQARKVGDWFYGLKSDGLVHWLDPMSKNALPAHWSFPGLGVTDGPPLGSGLRPTAVTTATNAKNLPAVSARYTSAMSPTGRGVYIPIPPGHAAHVGVHSAGAAVTRSIVYAQPYAGESALGLGGTAAIALPAIAAADSTRFTTVIPRTGTMTGIELVVRPGATVAGNTLPASGDLAGLMVEILPTGQAPQGSGFIRGGGNSGCRIFEPPTQVVNSAYYDRMSVAAKLIEVGP